LNYFGGDKAKAIKAKANTFGKSFMDWFGDWVGANAVYDEEGNRVDNVSGVLDYNGEPLVVHHRTNDNFNEFDRRYSHHSGFWFSNDKDYYYGARGTNDIPCFVSIKAPNIIPHHDFIMGVDGDPVSENLDDTEYDGWITFDKYDPSEDGPLYDDEDYVEPVVFVMATKPNQIKSINNDGTFTDGNNIYHNLKSSSPKSVNEIASVIEDILRDYYNFHRYYGLKETLNNRDRVINEDVILKVEHAFGFPAGTIQLSEKGTGIKINKRLIQDNIEQFRNSINHSTVTYYKYAINLVEFMKSKFPQIKGIRFAESSEWNGMFKDGYVYLNFNSSLDVAAEECLHPFIEAIFSENKQLFD